MHTVIRGGTKQEAPTAGVEAEVCVFWPYGDDPQPSTSDAYASDCRSIFCEVMGSTKKLSLETAKPSAVRSQRLCLRPPYVPFSRTASVGSSDHAAFASNPSAQESGRAARPEKKCRSHDGFFAASQVPRFRLWKRAAPMGVSGPSLTHRAIWGRAATTLFDAGGSESTTRQCRV
jgi:hypothetical protein